MRSSLSTALPTRSRSPPALRSLQKSASCLAVTWESASDARPLCEHAIVKLRNGTFNAFLRVPWDVRWKIKDSNLKRAEPWADALGYDMARQGVAWRRLEDIGCSDKTLDHLRYPVFTSEETFLEFVGRCLKVLH